MHTYSPEFRFDLIFSINSILPTTRAQVAQMLEKIHDALAPNGILLAILPSFDTTEQLLEYWKDRYAELEGVTPKLTRSGRDTALSRYVQASRAWSRCASRSEIELWYCNQYVGSRQLAASQRCWRYACLSIQQSSSRPYRESLRRRSCRKSVCILRRR